MSSARPKPPSGCASRALWRRRFGLTLCFLVLVGSTATVPAAAQTSEGGASSSTGVGPPAASEPATGGAPVTPAFPGAAPDTLPPPPSGGFGLPNPTAPPYSVNNEIPTLTSPPTLRLAPYAGVVPLQAYDPNAPAVLIQPNVYLGETFTDNVNYVHSPRKFAADHAARSRMYRLRSTRRRLQAVATGQANGTLYLPGSNSSFEPDLGTLYANGHGTIYPDAVYVDAQSSITQSSTLPGFGFQNLSNLPRNQQTQQFINNVSPYCCKVVRRPWADTELRYTFSSSNYGGNTVVTDLATASGLNNLTSTTLNEGTFIAATGENFQKSLARFTADACRINSSSASQSTQVSAFNDFQNIVYPDDRGARPRRLSEPALPGFAGGDICWGHLAGRRAARNRGAGSAGLCCTAVRQAAGCLRFHRIVPGQHNTRRMVLTASLVQGVSSQGQLFSSNLATSTLSPSGAVVNQATGLPTALYSPGLGYIEQRLSPARLQCRLDRLAAAELLFAIRLSTRSSSR